MFKKINKKGFTLAELLIVVAIIGILVAISIPIFTTQLEKSREATDVANLRSAYAAGQVAAMTGYYGTTSINNSTTTLYYNPGVDGSLDGTGISIGQGTGTDGKADTSAFTSFIKYSTGSDVKGKKIKVTISNGACTGVEFAS